MKHVSAACAEGHVKLRWRNLTIRRKANGYDITSISFQHPHYNPNETVELEFTLGHHSFLFEPGDRLRLDVSSSAYPLFHPHTNRKGLQAAQNGADIAVNTIVTGPSNIRFYESN